MFPRGCDYPSYPIDRELREQFILFEGIKVRFGSLRRDDDWHDHSIGGCFMEIVEEESVFFDLLSRLGECIS